MKRLIQSKKFQDSCFQKARILVSFDFDEIPLDLDLTGFDNITISNVLYDDCRVLIHVGENIVGLKFPSYICNLFALARFQGQDNCISQLKKMTEEDRMVKNKEQSNYDNVMGVSFLSDHIVREGVSSAYHELVNQGVTPNFEFNALVKHINKKRFEFMKGNLVLREENEY